MKPEKKQSGWRELWMDEPIATGLAKTLTAFAVIMIIGMVCVGAIALLAFRLGAPSWSLTPIAIVSILALVTCVMWFFAFVAKKKRKNEGKTMKPEKCPKCGLYPSLDGRRVDGQRIGCVCNDPSAKRRSRPVHPCRRCEGKGEDPHPRLSVWDGPCPRCRGTGDEPTP